MARLLALWGQVCLNMPRQPDLGPAGYWNDSETGAAPQHGFREGHFQRQLVVGVTSCSPTGCHVVHFPLSRPWSDARPVGPGWRDA